MGMNKKKRRQRGWGWGWVVKIFIENGSKMWILLMPVLVYGESLCILFYLLVF